MTAAAVIPRAVINEQGCRPRNRGLPVETNFTPVQAEFTAVPFPALSVQAVIFNASLHYAESYEATLAEALRVLQPDGLLVIMDSPVYHDADFTLRSYAEIRDIWDGLGMTSAGPSDRFDKDVVFYCGSGYRSSLTFLYAHLMGFKNVRNYSDGWAGWSTAYSYDPVSCADSITPEWCQEPSGRPFVTGP